MFEKYQSLPKVIEAVRFTDENKDRVHNELTGQYAANLEDGKPILKVTTIHGDIAIVRLGDWIIKENKLGFYYPIKDDIFRAHHANALEWTSVEDNLPDIGKCLVYINPKFSHSFQSVATFFNDEFEVDGHMDSNAADFITHWMLLPRPPHTKE